jgi:AcrR family transcriptional regulator
MRDTPIQLRLHQRCIIGLCTPGEDFLARACVRCGAGFCSSCLARASAHGHTASCPNCRGAATIQYAVTPRDRAVRDALAPLRHFGATDDAAFVFLESLDEFVLGHFDDSALLEAYLSRRRVDRERPIFEDLGLAGFRAQAMARVWTEWRDQFVDLDDLFRTVIACWGHEPHENLRPLIEQARDVSPGQARVIGSSAFVRLRPPDQRGALDLTLVPSLAPGFTRVYHGTNLASASAIIHEGVQLLGRPHLDFNIAPAFYAGDCFDRARVMAVLKGDGSPAVVVFDVREEALRALKIAVLHRGTHALDSHVRACRSRGRMEVPIETRDCDVVVGPALKNVRTHRDEPLVWLDSFTQTCFLTWRAAEILNRSEDCTRLVIMI